jgi:hypothetical protein
MSNEPERTWKRGPFPEHLGYEWLQPQSDTTHSEWWAEHWASLGCNVIEVTKERVNER